MSDFELLREIAKAPGERIDRHKFAELTKGENAVSVYQRLESEGFVEAGGQVEEINMPLVILITAKGKKHIDSAN